MSQQTRWVVLDAQDAGNYTGGTWTFYGISPTAFLETLTTSLVFPPYDDHTPSDTNMTFAFEGSEFLLLGETSPGHYDGDDFPQWKCTMDGSPLQINPPSGQGEFSVSWKGSSDSNHTFQMVRDSFNGSLSIDSVWYHPTPNSADLKNALVVYDYDDPNVRLSQSGDWKTLTHGGDNATFTTTKGSSLSVFFTGTEVIAQGWSATGFPAGISEGSYSINGGLRTQFKILPPDPSTETVHNKTLFQRSGLDKGVLHNLTVTYEGPSTPLVLHRFLVRDGNFRIGDDPIPAAAPAATSTTTPNSNFKSTGKIIQIVVPTVIGFFVLCFLIGWFLGCFGMRRKRFATKSNPPQAGEYDQVHMRHNDSETPLTADIGHPPRLGLFQNLSGFSVDGGGEAHIAGRDNTSIVIHSLTVHSDASSPNRLQ